VLLEPVVANELALAVADLDSRKAVCLTAIKLLDVIFVVVSNVLSEGRLLVESRVLPLGTVCVPNIVGAFVPRLEDGHCVVVVLDNHEARVGVRAVEAVRIVLRRLRVPGVFGHGNGVLGLDVPVVQHPLDRDVQEAEGSVGVEEYDELVLLDVVRQRRRLDPRCVAVFEVGRLDELVVVAVDDSVRVVVENAARHVVDVAPVILALLEVGGRLQRARLEVQHQDLAAQRLLVARVRRQLEVAAIGLANEGLGRGGLQGRIESADDVVDGRGRLFRVNGAVDAVSANSGGCSGSSAPVPGQPSAHFNVRFRHVWRIGAKGHVRGTLPSHDAENEDNDGAGAHGERKQRVAPSSG
jgi:hypothetical protein